MIAPTDLRSILRSGLLSFPVTPFDADDNFSARAFAAHLEWLSPHKIADLIVAGGTQTRGGDRNRDQKTLQ